MALLHEKNNRRASEVTGNSPAPESFAPAEEHDEVQDEATDVAESTITQNVPTTLSGEASGTATNADPFADDDFHVYVYCRVKLPDSGAVVYYRTEDHSLRKGNAVLVPSPITGDAVAGEILAVELHMCFSVPTPIEETQVILRTL